MRAQRLQVGGEHAVGAEQALDAHRGGDVGGRRAASRRSAMASTSMPSMPSVPLISARPSFSAQLDRRDARGAQRVGGLAQLAGGVADRPLAHQRERAVRERREVAGAAERAVLVDDRRDPGGEHRGVGRRRRGRTPVRPVGERRQPQQHHRPHDLALDLRRPSRRRGCGSGCAAAARAARPGCAGWRARRSRWRRRSAGRASSASASTIARLRPIAAERLVRRARRAAPWRATATTSSKLGGAGADGHAGGLSMARIRASAAARSHRSAGLPSQI